MIIYSSRHLECEIIQGILGTNRSMEARLLIARHPDVLPVDVQIANVQTFC